MAPSPDEERAPDSARAPEKAVLRRAFVVLDAFAGSQEEQTISGICRQTDLPPSTVHRILATMIDWGGVERTGRGRYRLGLKFWKLGSQVPQARQLRDVALPFLEDLYEATHEVVHLGVRDGLDLLYVEKISGRRSVHAMSSVGRRLPLHATGPGKVLLAHGGPELLDDVLAHGLSRRTPHTITDPTELRSALAHIRQTGVAVSRNEASMGTASVAAPICDSTGTVVASVSVVMPDDRIDVPQLIPLVKTIARAISRQSSKPL
ncbi:IclR family transcriptional regulator [Prauserella flavalba]|uniref:IclR family transcriptional regulator n=1 Tax=Prauserella flavalba TaxID=1477506 RepID=UPI0036E54B67